MTHHWDVSQSLPPDFFNIAQTIYHNDDYWLPEDPVHIQHQFSADNDYFQNNIAWLNTLDQQARLAGFFNPNLKINGNTVAFFGFWETTNDLTLNTKLFTEFEQWAAKNGATEVYGPINFNTYGKYRLRLDSFAEPCFLGEPYNLDYYPGLLKQLGYHDDQRYITRYALTPKDTLAQVNSHYAEKLSLLEQYFRIEALTPEFWLAHLDQLYPIIDITFKQNFGYTSISYEQFKKTCGFPFAKILCPNSSVVAFDKTDNQLAGFFITFPDYSPLLRQGNPERCQPQQLNYKVHAQSLPSPSLLLAKTAGIQPKYRNVGLFTALSYEVSRRGALHYDHFAGCLVRDDNQSLNFIDRHAELLIHYALYKKVLKH